MSVSLSTVIGRYPESHQELVRLLTELVPALDESTKRALSVLLMALGNNPDLTPKLSAETEREVLAKWLQKYHRGFENRISKRISRLPGTVPDPIIDFIIGCRFPRGEEDLSRIRYAHRLSMSAENILGLLLEEFLALTLSDYGWYCCWGQTIRDVDFCHKDGRLLQIKNRSNSENGPARRVRDGTAISKWHRVNAQTGVYEWSSLSDEVGLEVAITEKDFRDFIESVLKRNPRALAVEDSNPWGFDGVGDRKLEST